MSDANPPVVPPPLPPGQPAAAAPVPAARPPAAPTAAMPIAAPATARPTGASGIGASIVAVTLALLLADLAVETFLAGSPLLASVVVVEVLVIVLLALLWSRVGPTTRVMIPLIGLAGLVAWAVVRGGAGADPALRMATLTLPRIAVALTAVAVLMAALTPLILFGRRWYFGVPLTLVGLYALVPLARAMLVAAALPRVLAGEFDWQSLPFWLQGGYLGGAVVLPLGLLVGLCALVVALVKRRSALWPAIAVVLLLFVSLAAAAELVRAGRPTVARVVVLPVLGQVSAAPAAALVQSVGAAADAGAVPVATEAVAPPVAVRAGAATPAARPADESSSAPPPAAVAAVAVAEVGQGVSNKAVEVRVLGARTMPAVGGRTPAPGREFVAIDTSWKNIIPLAKVNRKKAGDRTAGAGSLGFGGGATAQDRAKDEADTTLEPTKFEIGPMPNLVWLIADGPRAEALDVGATNATPGHLPAGTLTIPALNDVRTGSLVYETAADSQSLALLVLDSINGHMLIPIRGAAPRPASGLGGASRSNSAVDLAVTGVNWSSGPADRPGTRMLVVGVKGISRQEAIADIPFGDFGFLQTDQGCMARPENKPESVARPLSPMGRFPPFAPSEGQLAFVVPADSKSATLLLRVRERAGSLDLPVIGNAKPAWPSPASTVTDGDVLKVHLLPGTAVPAGVPPASSGSERIALDLVVENLRANDGVELQLDQQFRLVTPDSKRIGPSGDSAHAPCSLTGDVVPAGSSRRFTLVYDVPPGQPLQFEYRGFNVKSEMVKVR
jgi:hypothetical protein